ncbi:FAD binding domain-containing protein [Sphingomonas immobilis]|uniref:Xanthine dehydrogenase family protein subunit M n=1 Tax=Sphingomonas immobilis TaxID=3063997 RepID=A0ABT8ZYK5_9SPHN|nr:xanthine dehydrogenase family protein subunit M [Sphingomonas sp. CA1-15]MDO7842194.1 xanthine dehydrogenase family protein subunit M [Sphingomonas sp. CA1-15]
MKAAPFDYVVADSVEGAVEALADHAGDAALLAGGQTLVPLLALRMAMPGVLIDINRIDGLAGIARSGGATRIGATTRQNTILHDPLVARHVPALARATGFVGHHQTRNRGTIGGSLGLAEPAAEYPATALALGARIEARSPSATREIAIEDYFLGPYTTALDMDEMITAAIFPDWPEDTIHIVHEVARRPGDFALVGLVAAFAVEGGVFTRAGIGWFGMGPTPMKSARAEAALIGQPAATVDLAGIARLAIEDTDPMSDIHADAAYRRTVGARIFERIVGDAIGQRKAA